MFKLKEKFGHRIQELRHSLRMTQEVLAEKIDMDTPNLSNIENGKRFMTPENIEKIALALGVDVKDLFDYGHLKTREELILSINDFLKNTKDENIEFVYKFICNLKEYK